MSKTSVIEISENAIIPNYTIENSSMNNGENKINSLSDEKNYGACKNCNSAKLNKTLS